MFFVSNIKRESKKLKQTPVVNGKFYSVSVCIYEFRIKRNKIKNIAESNSILILHLYHVEMLIETYYENQCLCTHNKLNTLLV